MSASTIVSTHLRRRRNHGGVARSRGFTVVELMVTIFVLAILLTIGIPNFNDAVLGARLSSMANNLLAAVQVARSESVKRNSVITLCASANGVSCAASGGWEQGWIVLSGATVLRSQQALPTSYRVTQSGGTASLTFVPTMVGTTPATFTVCRSSPVGKQERVLTVGPTGVAYVTRTENGSCPTS